MIEKENLKNLNYKIFNSNRDEIFQLLPTYDIGLVFKYRQMDKNVFPTKIGEYLAAGLFVIGSSGLYVLDRLSDESESVKVVKCNSNGLIFDDEEIQEFLSKLKENKHKKESRNLAYKYYSLEEANKIYQEIYKEILYKI